MIISSWLRNYRYRSLFLISTILTAPIVSALVTYTFISLPDASISLDTRGTLVLMVVMLEIFLIGATGIFPIDLNKLVRMRGRRGAAWKNAATFVEDFPCSIRILCELETAAKTFDGESNADSSAEGLNSSLLSNEDYVNENELLEKNLIEDFQRVAVKALSLNETESNTAMYRLGSLTGEGVCEEAYLRCGRDLSPRTAIKILFAELEVEAKQ